MPQSRIPVLTSKVQEDCLKAWAGATQSIQAEDTRKASEAYQRFLESTTNKKAGTSGAEKKSFPKSSTTVKPPTTTECQAVEKAGTGRRDPGRPERSENDKWVIVSHDDSDWELI
ncbi:hypothetical protein HJFPF1_05605 [Paramyrothecium foliicola]|nr:hypothetical protein HJFPF1_05605 [Paramyrothecium foliicola]